MSGKGFESLVDIMDRLRGPDGCPWDREQDLGTLRGYLLEECYEVVDALDRCDWPELCEELGDLLFQIVFIARLASEEGRFAIGDVVAGIRDKMIRRHPHVFGSETAETSDEVLAHWERIKRQEKAAAAKDGEAAPSRLDRIPAALPGLAAARRLGDEAARIGFDWKRAEDVLGKVDEELGELRDAVRSGDGAAAREELGDMLFCLAMLGRRLAVDPEEAVQRANAKFRRRFVWMEREMARRGDDPDRLGLDGLEGLWGEAKRSLAAERGGRQAPENPGQGAPTRPSRRKRS